MEAYDGTLLFVSHDRYFINRFATRVWELADGVVTDYPVGFERYRRIKTELQPAEEKKVVKEKALTEKKPKPNRNAQSAKR